MTVKDYQNKITTIFKAYNLKLIELNEWEIGFLESIDIRLNSNEELTWKQFKILNKIYGRVE